MRNAAIATRASRGTSSGATADGTTPTCTRSSISIGSGRGRVAAPCRNRNSGCASGDPGLCRATPFGVGCAITPKAFHNIAQGRRRRTLGCWGSSDPHLLAATPLGPPATLLVEDLLAEPALGRRDLHE